MFAVVFAAVKAGAIAAFGWFLRTVVIRFIVLAVLFVIVSEFGTLLLTFLPSWMSLDGAFDGVAPGVWYFLDYFNISFGAPLMVSAFLARFLIRRIPVIG